MSDIRTDILLKHMASSNITPVAAFGVFRGQPIEGLFLKTPDPTTVEAGLESVLSKDMLAKLKASGELQDLTLHLSQLMQAVRDDAQTLESQRRLIQSAQAQYEGLLGQSGPQAAANLQAAQSELIHAWLDFNSQAAKSKSDVIELSGEIQALGYSPSQEGTASSSDISSEAQPSGELSQGMMAYWADRTAASDFTARQQNILDGFGPLLSQDFKERLSSDIQAWSRARSEARRLRSGDLPAVKKDALLVQNDAAGKQEAVEQDLAALVNALSSAGSSSAAASSDLKQLLVFLQNDMDAQANATKNQRLKYNKSVEELRKTYWDSLSPGLPPKVAGAFTRLESLQKSLREDWQSLLDSYMENDSGTEPFIMKDVQLDAYLKDQHAFNQEIISLLKSEDVRKNPAALEGLEALYDVRTALNQEIAVAQYGRGMAALDALIELDQVRLDAARGESKGPDAIAAAAQSLQTLEAMKQRWLNGTDSLQPVYAVLPIMGDGKGVSVVAEWLTQKEIDARQTNGQGEPLSGTIMEKGGRYYLDTGENQFPIAAGVDGFQNGVDAAQAAVAQNKSLIDLGLSKVDFVPEKLVKGEPDHYSAQQVFGLAPPPTAGAGAPPPKQPLFLFYQIPGAQSLGTAGNADAPSRLLPEAVALTENPKNYAVYAYTGPEKLSYDNFPTLQSLKDSPEYKDVQKLDLTLTGASDASKLAYGMGLASLRKGWIALKLNSYGFALDGQNLAKVYQTRDEFDAAESGLRNAKDGLEAARAALKRDGALADAEKKKFETVEAQYNEQLAKYQKALSGRKQQLEKMALGDLAQKPGEPDVFYKVRVESRVDALIKGDAKYQAIMKNLAPFAKKFDAEKLKNDAAQAQVDDDQKAVDKAGAVLSDAQKWSLYRTDDLSLELAGDGTLVGVKAPLAYGQTFLDESLVDKTQGGQAAAVSINGTLDAAVLNRDGQVVKYYQGSDAVEKAAKTWIMAGVAMKGENAAVENGGQVKTNYRLDYYEDPATKLPVELSERYVRDRVEHDKHSLFYREHWGFMPQNWFSLVMNVPDQIIGTPIELAGRDPNRQHYLGRVNMNHSEGGETQHHGFFRSALGFVDVLDLLPDPVKIYDDPSQFPTQSRISSPVMPGQDVYSKSLRNPKDGENVHFGAKAVAQGLRYSLEDLTDVQQQTLSYFRGGYEDLIISRMRGRDGTYEESQRAGRSGADAVTSKLEDQGPRDQAYDPLAAADARSAMNGVTETASPDNV
ncbi:MAG: hypothetical protein KGL04_05150, partial [Elusimicrobia bacterium]|nr:hypothetical protein [Elusimicrobiota bacterium]